jgi:hypothetical protein
LIAADYLTNPNNYFAYGSLINDTVNATLPGLPALIPMRMYMKRLLSSAK